MKAIILRRRGLGKTSVREVCRFAQEAGVDLQTYRNDAPWPKDVDMVFRWGCTSHTQGNPTIINSSAMIHSVADKKTSRILLAEEGMAPTTWATWQDVPVDAAGGLLEAVVVRRATHHQGRYLHVCRTLPELRAACGKYPEGYYISTLINKVAEYRVFVVEGRAVWVAKKTPGDPDAVAWNVARGGRFDNVRWGEWPLEVVDLAIKAANKMNITFTGVDIMVDAAGKAYVLELNSAPSQTSPYRQECTSKAFQHIVKEGKVTQYNVGEGKGYRKYIHPSLTNEAIL